MNGGIENSNKLFGAKFWEEETFISLEDIRTKSKHFVSQHNDLSVWKNRDNGLAHIEPVRLLKNAMEIYLDKLPLTEDKIHFIRQVGDGGRINVLNEAFNVGEEFTSEYVRATIRLKKQKIVAYYRAQDQDAAGFGEII